MINVFTFCTYFLRFLLSEEDNDDQANKEQARRTLRIVTTDLPQFLVVISRIYQDAFVVGSAGETIGSKCNPQVQVAFPPGAFKRTTKVKLLVCVHVLKTFMLSKNLCV